MNRFLFPAVLLVAGCAGLPEGGCTNDWRQLGWRDGSASGQSSLAQYQARCPGADAAAYNAGWAEGRREKDSRRF
jgi:hypothetical protein